MRLARLTTLLALLLCLLAPVAARADFGSLYEDYTADGAIDGCKHSPGELRAGLAQTPADVRQYDPGFATALEGALEQRLGGCKQVEQAPASGGGTRTTDDGSPGPRNVRAPAAASGGGSEMPGVVVAMIVLLGGVLCVAAVFAVARFFGWDLEGRLPSGAAARRLGERLSDRVYAVRNRLGF